MEIESLLAQYSPLLKKYWLPLALFLLGLMFFIYGLISFLGTSTSPENISFKAGSEASSSSATIWADIEGAVVAPGVYKLTANSITQDLLVAAQGLSADADRDWISKNLNLAAKLSDGAKIYIPKAEETAGQTANSISNSQGQININAASSDELDSLPGIGPATASKIIGNRPYSKIEDLLDKGAVSSKVFEQIKDKISTF